MNVITLRAYLLASTVLLALGVPAQAQQANTTFFITSVGPGKGGDLGGLAGADAHCSQLATAAGRETAPIRSIMSGSAA